MQHRLLDHPNATYVPPVPQAELPAQLKPMDTPYKTNGFTQYVFPSKIYECLATGKPLVETPLPDLRGNSPSTSTWPATQRGSLRHSGGCRGWRRERRFGPGWS